LDIKEIQLSHEWPVMTTANLSSPYLKLQTGYCDLAIPEPIYLWDNLTVLPAPPPPRRWLDETEKIQESIFIADRRSKEKPCRTLFIRNVAVSQQRHTYLSKLRNA
jgi:hypothetical protein